MPRGRKPKADEAAKLYQQGKSLTDIAKELGVSAGTVRSWKKRYDWDRTKAMFAADNVNIVEDVKSVLKNEALTDRQRLFCLYYVRCFNATRAYQKAYECDYYSAKAHGYELLQNVAIKNEIAHLKQAKLNRAMLDEHDIFQRMIDIAFADITDYITFGPSGVVLHDSSQVEGSLIREVKEGKGGVSIRLHDQLRATEWLAEHMDMATTEQKAKIEKMQTEIEKIKNDKSSPDIPNHTSKDSTLKEKLAQLSIEELKRLATIGGGSDEAQ